MTRSNEYTAFQCLCISMAITTTLVGSGVALIFLITDVIAPLVERYAYVFAFGGCVFLGALIGNGAYLLVRDYIRHKRARRRYS